MSGIAAAAISAGAALAGTAATTMSTGKLNKKNRQWQEDRMREQNAYNHPSQQMARLREAGINPHLAYSQGSISNSSAGVNSPASHPQDFSGIGDAAQSYIATRMQQTQIDQMKKSIEVADAEKSLKEAQEIATLSGAAKTDQELLEMQSLLQTKIDQSKANLNQTNVNTELARKQIEKVLQDVSSSKTGQKLSESQITKIGQEIQESVARIKLLKSQGRNTDVDSAIKEIQQEMWRNGVNPNSSASDQVMKMILDIVGVSPKDGGIKNQTGGKTLMDGARWLKKQYDNMGGISGWFKN